MSHLHVPDGVLPLWLVLAGWLITALLVTVSVRSARERDLRRKIPLVGAVAALMLVGMSSEIVPIAYHINLTVVDGILLGPGLSALTALVVVTLLALLGHGGVTVIGLNVIVIAAEMALGRWLFLRLTRLLSRRRIGLSAGIATVLTLALTTTLVVVIVALGGTRATSRETGAFNPTQMRFENPLSRGLIANEGAKVGASEGAPLAIGRFALLVYTLGSIGWVIEALVTAGIVGFIAKVRPSLVSAEGVEHGQRHLGDEGLHR